MEFTDGVVFAISTSMLKWSQLRLNTQKEVLMIAVILFSLLPVSDSAHASDYVTCVREMDPSVAFQIDYRASLCRAFADDTWEELECEIQRLQEYSDAAQRLGCL